MYFFLQEFESSLNMVFHRELKLHFLQVLTPGQAYPERCCPSDSESSYSPQKCNEEPVPSGAHRKNFNVEEFGLSWETIETMHFFIFPGVCVCVQVCVCVCAHERMCVYYNASVGK